jgi:hypothetical protein
MALERHIIFIEGDQCLPAIGGQRMIIENHVKSLPYVPVAPTRASPAIYPHIDPQQLVDIRGATPYPL